MSALTVTTASGAVAGRRSVSEQNPALTIRMAVRHDLPAILDIYRRSGLDRDGGLTVEDAEAVFRRFSDYPSYRIYVACTSEGIVGTFALLVMDNLAHSGSPSGIVEDVAVLPSAMGMGVGKAMMTFARSVCREKGCYKLVLSSNQVREGAHAFYEAIGFQRHGFSFRVQP
jgi:ribosomal protein S18 acetylase RimI-like enzyme